jgi:serine/threonine-protein kinase RsbW
VDGIRYNAAGDVRLGRKAAPIAYPIAGHRCDDSGFAGNTLLWEQGTGPCALESFPMSFTRFENPIMRTVNQEGSITLTIASDPSEVQRIQDHIESQLKHHQFEDKDIFSIRLALEEALVNAIKHGNQLDPDKKVHVHCAFKADRFEVAIADEGPGFNPEDVPDPLCEENLERPCGRGLFLIRHYMTDVTYHAPGNRVSMFKLRKPVNGHPYLNGNCNCNGNGEHI